VVPTLPADGDRADGVASMMSTHPHTHARTQQAIDRATGRSAEPSQAGRAAGLCHIAHMRSAMPISIGGSSETRGAPFARAGSPGKAGGGCAG
jgi:hypothetical protein